MTFKVLRVPGKCDTHILIKESGLRQKLMPLADMGIIPYDTGYWNETNYVIRVS
jgi:hypothetical protein